MVAFFFNATGSYASAAEQFEGFRVVFQSTLFCHRTNSASGFDVTGAPLRRIK